MTHFGSGWAWLVDDGSGMRVMTTDNADLPLVHSARHCSRLTCGNTPTTSTTGTRDRHTSTHSWISSSTGITSTACSAETVKALVVCHIG